MSIAPILAKRRAENKFKMTHYISSNMESYDFENMVGRDGIFYFDIVTLEDGRLYRGHTLNLISGLYPLNDDIQRAYESFLVEKHLLENNDEKT